MSASPYLRSCNDLGVCQDRLHRCTDCQDAERSVRVVRMINSRRVHTVQEPAPFRAAPILKCGQHGVCLDDIDCEVKCKERAGGLLTATIAALSLIVLFVLALVALSVRYA